MILEPALIQQNNICIRYVFSLLAYTNKLIENTYANVMNIMNIL